MNIIYNATEGLMKGINKAVELIKPTYGVGGVNVIIESRMQPRHFIANDCWSIIKDIKLDDPAERIGLDFVKELVSRQDKLSGDSRKTSLLLLNEILKQGYEADINKLQLKKDLDALIPIIENEIDKQTREISIDEVKDVAQTASENEEIGTLLQNIYKEIGKSGIIQCEGSGTYETSYRIIDGVRFDMASMLSPYMVHNDKSKAVYEKPIILVTKKKIMSDDDINPLLNEMADSGQKDLVIFTSDMDTGVVQMLIDLHKSHRFNICIIKVPTLWRDYYYEDFSKCVGATVIEDGMSFKNMHLTMLGTCDKITVDGEETILIGTKDITEHIAQLQQQGTDDSKLRLGWLNNKTAILKLGSNSETDLSYRLLKTYDAIHSSELALKYGVVKGGGKCLAMVANMLPGLEQNAIAGNIMKIALCTPIYQIGLNSGTELIPDNIVDASAVIKNAIRNSVGIASTLLTSSALIYLPDEPIIKEQQNAFQG
jgi:chaperonin GroEL